MSKMWKRLALKEAEDEIIGIEDSGHEVEKFTDTHWRIDGKIDVWPSTRKYMILDGKFIVRFYKKIIDLIT